MLPAVRGADAAPLARGDVLVVATGDAEDEAGGLLLVDRHGTRTPVRDFADPTRGPLLTRATDAAATPAGRLLVLDAGFGGAPGGVIEIARDGSRRRLSDFGDPRTGMVASPGRLAAASDGLWR